MSKTYVIIKTPKGDVHMENINVVLAANILKYRKKSGLTQEELANKLDVTFQAVSKWENAKASPDITFLPIMADIFGCYIDELFSREIKTEIHYDHCPEFPWADDTIIRGVVCEGRKILQVSSLVDRFTFEIIGDVKNVQSECNIEVAGNVSGGCKSGGGINVGGSVSGGCMSNGNTVIAGDLSGGCNSGYSIIVGGNLSGGCNTGNEITCGGNLSGDVTCGGTVRVTGDVESKEIKGNVICNSLKCEIIKGEVTINKQNR